MLNHYMVAYHNELTNRKILKSVHKIVPLQSDSCYSLRKTGDFLWKYSLGEEERIKHDEQISYDVIVLDNIDVDSILTK